MRAGTYFERGLNAAFNGYAGGSITITAFPGERVVISGAVADFMDAPNNAWEVVDANIGLFRTVQPFASGLAPQFVGGWLLDDDVQLVQYDRTDCLESTNYSTINGMDPVYIGPGVQLRADGHAYIRLETRVADAPLPPDLPADPDPRNNRIALFEADLLLSLAGANHVTFRNIEFAHSKELVFTTPVCVVRGACCVPVHSCGKSHSYLRVPGPCVVTVPFGK